MTSLPGDEPTNLDPPNEPETPAQPSSFTGPTAEMKRRARITGLLFFALFLVFLSISLWRKFIP